MGSPDGQGAILSGRVTLDPAGSRWTRPGRGAVSSLRLRGTPQSIGFCSRGDPPPSARREETAPRPSVGGPGSFRADSRVSSTHGVGKATFAVSYHRVGRIIERTIPSMKAFRFLAPALLALVPVVPLALAQTPALPAAPPVERPLAELPYTPSLEPSFMDRSIDPCVDSLRLFVQRLDDSRTRSRRTRAAGASTASSTRRTSSSCGASSNRPRSPIRSARRSPPDRRLLRVVHGRAGHRPGRRWAAPPELDEIARSARLGDIAALVGRLHLAAAPTAACSSASAPTRTRATRRRSSPSPAAAGSGCRTATTT